MSGSPVKNTAPDIRIKTAEFRKVDENDFETALSLTVLLSAHMKAVFVASVRSHKKPTLRLSDVRQHKCHGGEILCVPLP